MIEINNLPSARNQIKALSKTKNKQKQQLAKVVNDQSSRTSPRIFHPLESSTGSILSSRRYANSSQGYRKQKLSTKNNKKSIKLKVSMITFSSNLDNHKLQGKNEELYDQRRNFIKTSHSNYLSQQLQPDISNISKQYSTSLYLRKNSPKKMPFPEQNQTELNQISLDYIPCQIFPCRKKSSKLRTRFSSFSNSKPLEQKKQKMYDINALLGRAKKSGKIQFSPKMHNKMIAEKLKQGKINHLKNARVPKMMYFEDPSYRKDPMIEKFFQN